MSEIRLVVREGGQDWSGTVHGSMGDGAIAALSADPVTLAELEAAYARFARPTSNRLFLSNLRPGLCTEPDDAGIVVIDLVARLVVVDSTWSSPRPVAMSVITMENAPRTHACANAVRVVERHV